jgi:hypothetical protein
LVSARAGPGAHSLGSDPLPRGKLAATGFLLLRSLPYVSAKLIIFWFIVRWNIEVTFEELRAHLGFETQRQWSDKAIERTTPCLFGIFSLVVLMAKELHPDDLPIQQSSWYPKQEAA